MWCVQGASDLFSHMISPFQKRLSSDDKTAPIRPPSFVCCPASLRRTGTLRNKITLLSSSSLSTSPSLLHVSSAAVGTHVPVCGCGRGSACCCPDTITRTPNVDPAAAGAAYHGVLIRNNNNSHDHVFTPQATTEGVNLCNADEESSYSRFDPFVCGACGDGRLHILSAKTRQSQIAGAPLNPDTQDFTI